MEVKFKFKYLALAIGIVAGLASCNNDKDVVDPGTGPIVDEGTPTSLRIALSQPKSTYAPTADPNATVDEAAIVTVDAFLYNSAGNLVKHEELSASDFDYQDPPTSTTLKDVYEGEFVIETTTGLKKLYVGVNLPTDMREMIRSNGTIAGVSKVYNLTLANLTNTTNGFTMFSTTEVEKTLVEDPVGDGDVNRMTVQVSRLVAKVSAHEGDNLDLSQTVSGGKISNLEFAIANSNTKIYPFQQKSGGKVIDPNYSVFGTDYTASDFITFNNYVAINPAISAGTAIEDVNVKYTPENTSLSYYQGESTYITVKADFVPGSFSDADGVETANSSSTAASFWIVNLADGDVKYFNSQTVANDYIDNNPTLVAASAAPIEYTDGECYYIMYLNPRDANARYSTLRNAYYRASITKINGLGNPGPDPTEPGEQIDVPTNLVFDIEVLAWEVVDDDYELAP